MTMAEELARIETSNRYAPIIEAYWLAMLRQNRKGLREWKTWNI